MEKKLPEEFLCRMEALLGSSEFPTFLASYENPPEKGIRLQLKRLLYSFPCASRISYERLVREWHLVPLPEIDFREQEGLRYFREFYLDQKYMEQLPLRPGKHPYHEAGLYYLQEPSAMQVVPLLSIRPFDHVLDLCASPGGKSGQALDRLEASRGGYLIANEYVKSRARILSSNLERLGAGNAMVVSEDSAVLASHYPESFSRIIIDAPCSGEGMFRKDETAIAEWSPENVERCRERQREILRNALPMLRPGGKLSYSTCTFEIMENEEMRDFILRQDRTVRLCREKRVWPHRERGEGHYLCIFQKEGEDLCEEESRESRKRMAAGWEEKGGRLYFFMSEFPEDSGIHILRKGLLSHEDEKGKGELLLSHAFSHFLTEESGGEILAAMDQVPKQRNVEAGKTFKPEKEKNGKSFRGARGKRGGRRGEPWHGIETPKEILCYPLASDSIELKKYLRGEELSAEPGRLIPLSSFLSPSGKRMETEDQPGMDTASFTEEAKPEELPARAPVLILCDGISLGMAGLVKGRIKNRYPRGLRRKE